MSDAEKYVGRGYAPGGYCCICLTCNGQFIGEKRSWCCLGCAKSADRIEQLEAELAEARMQALSELGQAQEAYEAQKKAEAERDEAFARGKISGCLECAEILEMYAERMDRSDDGLSGNSFKADAAREVAAAIRSEA